MKQSIPLLMAAFILFGGTSHAGLISYDFRAATSQTYPGSLLFSEQGLVLTVNGQALSGTTIIDSYLYQDANGLGIKLISGSDGAEIDLSGPDEALGLQFNRNVQLISASFSQVGNNDDFFLSVTGNPIIRADIPGGNSADSDTGLYDFTAMNVLGNNFSFAPDTQYSEYSLTQITIHHAIPSPATLLLLLMGIPALLLRSKHRAQGRAQRDHY